MTSSCCTCWPSGANPPGDFDTNGELPGEDDVLRDTALYHAAAERMSRARALVRREPLVVGSGSPWVSACALPRSASVSTRAAGPNLEL